jgi:hypothetical protein
LKPQKLTRREALAAGALGLLAAAPASVVAAPATTSGAKPYLEDARTARAARLSVPRSPLREALKALSGVAGFDLAASPTLAEETLVGYVPRRPLRETMQAFETLFEARWVRTPSTGGGYLLTPDPARQRAEAEAYAATLKKIRAGVDAQATALDKLARAGKPLPNDVSRGEEPALLLWPHLPPADRDRVLRGTPVTITIPVERAGPLNVMMLNFSSREPAPLIEPLIATYDLDDPRTLGIPALRARVTGRREDSMVAGIGMIDLTRYGQPVRPTPLEEAPNSEVLPANVGNTGRFVGPRDDVVMSLAEACGVPILSRHRGRSDTTGVNAGERTLVAVLTDLAATCDAAPILTARGFCLLRDAGALPDTPLHPLPGPVAEYLKGRPAIGSPVTLERLAPLGALTPGQVSVLSRSNLCDEEALFTNGAHAVVRFRAALTAEQQRALGSEAGLEVTTLTHQQLHALIDARTKRGDFDVFRQQFAQMRGLRLRFREQPERAEDNLTLQGLRDGMVVVGVTLSLPVVEALARPTASA